MNNKLPQIHLIYNRKGKASPTQKAVVEIRVTHNYRQKYISTGVWLYPHQWDHGSIVNCENIIEISQILDKMLSDIRQAIFLMMKEGNLDIRRLSDKLEDKKEMTFLEFCHQRAIVRKYSKEKDTQKRYDRFLKYFSEWGRIKSFSD